MLTGIGVLVDRTVVLLDSVVLNCSTIITINFSVGTPGTIASSVVVGSGRSLVISIDLPGRDGAVSPLVSYQTTLERAS